MFSITKVQYWRWSTDATTSQYSIRQSPSNYNYTNIRHWDNEHNFTVHMNVYVFHVTACHMLDNWHPDTLYVSWNRPEGITTKGNLVQILRGIQVEILFESVNTIKNLTKHSKSSKWVWPKYWKAQESCTLNKDVADPSNCPDWLLYCVFCMIYLAVSYSLNQAVCRQWVHTPVHLWFIVQYNNNNDCWSQSGTPS